MAEEGFLERWSRRKRAAKRKGEAAPAGPGAVNAVAGDSAAEGESMPRPRAGVMNTEPRTATIGELAGPPAPPAEADADPTADLPPVEQLDESSDYTGFMRRGVPEELKNAALRKLWRSNPIFALRDGLDDYDEDFAALAAVGEKLMRLQKAGRHLTDGKPQPDAAAKPEVAADPEADAVPPESQETPPEAASEGTEEDREAARATASTEDASEGPAERPRKS